MGRAKQAKPTRTLKAKTTTINGVAKKQRKSPKFTQRVTIGRKMRADQKISDKLTIPLAPFSRLAHEIVGDILGIDDPRLTGSSVLALQEGAEAYITRLFHAAGRICAHAKREEIMVRDLHMALELMTPGELDRSLAERNQTLMRPRGSPVHAVDSQAEGEAYDEEE